MNEARLYGLTLEKLRNLIMKTPMCREGKSCKDLDDEPEGYEYKDICKYVNFCSIWNSLWPYAYTLEDGPVKNCADYDTKDLPVVIVGYIMDAVQEAFEDLIPYMRANNLLFNSDYTGFVKNEEQEETE